MRLVQSWWLIGIAAVALLLSACAPQAPAPTAAPAKQEPAAKAEPAAKKEAPPATAAPAAKTEAPAAKTAPAPAKAEPAAKPAAAPVTLKLVSAWTKAWIFNDKYFQWAERVNQKAAGRLKLDYVGGPEVYPNTEQLDPLKRGVIHSIVTSTGYIAGALPEINSTWLGFGATPAQLRAAGVVEALDKLTREKANVTLLGFPLQMNFNVFLKRPIEKADLTGFKLRSQPVYDPVFKALGAASVNLPPAEVQSALQTGVVDGMGWPAPFIVDPGYAQFISHKVSPAWWVGTDVALMEAKAFDGLPADLQKLLIDEMKQIENETPAYYLEKEKQQDEKLKSLGIKFIELPASEVEKVKKLQWQEGVKAYLTPSAQYGPKLQELFGRFAPK